jgi:hypothetical protein
MEDKKYPIYDITIQWIEDDVDNHREKFESTAKQSVDLPPGRIYNSIAKYRMFREKQEIDDIIAEEKQFWQNWDKIKDKNPELVKITVNFILEESWCPSWFSHWTFDDGQEDADILASFNHYVSRMEAYNEKHGRQESYGWVDAIRVGSVCLMGAEDRWRWRGIDDNENDTEAPCRCSGCKKNKVIRIVH